MKRRQFLAATLAAPLAGIPAFNLVQAADVLSPPSTSTPEWRCFEVTTRINLRDTSGTAQLWLPLAQTAGGYQVAGGLRYQGNGQTKLVHDVRHGAPILHTVWDGRDGEPPQLEVMQTVATCDRKASSFLPLTEAERAFWSAPSVSASADGIVLETARRITADQAEPRAKLRAIYDWVVDHTRRDPDVLGCGTGDYQANLLGGKLGGKCADINGLMVGLARAAGFPARDVYGLRVAESNLYPCLGWSGDVSKAQHCRAEVFLDDEGWFPVDPADVRKVALEQKLALDSSEGIALHERLFGFWEMNWIGYNSATNIQLPGHPASQKPAFSFLMYPHAITALGVVPCLDPAHFCYEITTRSLA